MLTLDGLVMIAVDDEDWRVDRLELRITSIWLLGPHLADLVDEAVVILRRRRMGSVLPAGALDIGGEGRVLLDAVLYTRRHRICCEGEDLAHSLLMTHGEIDAENGAIAPPHDVGLGNFQAVHQSRHVVGHQIIAVRPCIAGTAAMAAAVHENDRMMCRHGRDLIAPIVGIRQSTVQENDRRALAVHGIVDCDAVYMRVAAAVGMDWRRRRRQGLPSLRSKRRKNSEDKSWRKQKRTHDPLLMDF